MGIIDMNEKAWDNIGERASHPDLEGKKYLPMIDIFLSKLPKQGKVLDLGCGPGIPITRYIADKGFKVTATDLSQKMVDLCKKNVPDAECKKISMTDIDYENQFDGIISCYTMLCLDPERFNLTAEKIMKALKKGGYFLIILNEPDPDEEFNEEENYTNIMGQEMYSRPYTEEEIKQAFSGMKIIKTDHQVLKTKDYGTEYCLSTLLHKD